MKVILLICYNYLLIKMIVLIACSTRHRLPIRNYRKRSNIYMFVMCTYACV